MTESIDRKVDKIVELLGFDPAKQAPITKTILEDVVREEQAKRYEESRAKARSIVEQLVAKRKELDQARRQLEKAEESFEKSSTSLLNQVERAMRGEGPMPSIDRPDGEQ